MLITAPSSATLSGTMKPALGALPRLSTVIRTRTDSAAAMLPTESLKMTAMSTWFTLSRPRFSLQRTLTIPTHPLRDSHLSS